MADLPVGMVFGSNAISAVIPDASGVRIAETPLNPHEDVGDAVARLSAEQRLSGRFAVVALPAQLCMTAVRSFPPSMKLKERISNTRLVPNDDRFANALPSSRVAVGRSIDETSSLVGVTTREVLEQHVAWLKRGRLRPLHLVSEAAGWKSALGARYDGLVLPDVSNGTIALFDGPSPRAEYFTQSARGTWYDHAATFLGNLRTASSGAIAPRRMAIARPESAAMMKTLRDCFQCDVLELPTVLNPTTQAPEKAPSWLLAFGLANVDTSALDFLPALTSYRTLRLIQDHRQYVGLGLLGAALSFSLNVVLHSMAEADLRAALADKAQTTSAIQLAEQRIAIEALNIGGEFGNIDPIAPALLRIRRSGTATAWCFTNYGNALPQGAWTEELDTQPRLDSTESQPLPCDFAASVDTFDDNPNDAALSAEAAVAKRLAAAGIDARVMGNAPVKDNPGVTQVVYGTLEGKKQ